MHTSLVSAPREILQGLPLPLVLLAYSPVLVAAAVLVVGTICEAFRGLRRPHK
jgi:hypothetical protein